MSKAFDNAEMIIARLAAAPVAPEQETGVDITGVTAIIDRQKGILTEVAKVVKDTPAAVAITILWEGFRVLDKNSNRPRLGHAYNITTWSKPILADGALPADEVMEAIIIRLWHWVPGGGHVFGEVEVSNGGLVPDRTYLKYDCEVIIPTML